MNNQDYLCHYGVLGMKWGQHKARVNYQKADRAAAKGNKQQAAKFRARAEKKERRHRELAGDDATYDQVKNSSTMKLLGQSVVFGTYGALKYNQAKANGQTDGGAFVSAIVNGGFNVSTGGLRSILEPRVNANRRS